MRRLRDLRQNLQPPEVLTDYFTDSLDVLYKEGQTHPKMLNASIRCHYFGRAVGTKAVDKALHYGKSLPHVSFYHPHGDRRVVAEEELLLIVCIGVERI